MKTKKNKTLIATIMIFSIVILAGSIIWLKTRNEVSGSTVEGTVENSGEGATENSADNKAEYSAENSTAPSDAETNKVFSTKSHKSLTGTDDELVYCIASVSKIYSTAAVMQLVDEGKVKLDGYVTDYLPDFRMADERYKDITVRMLMNHTSGIMGTTQKGIFLYNEYNEYYENNILNVLSTQRLKADPGEYAAYCNDGFDLLALIVENVTGMEYNDYIRENLVEKTGGSLTGTASYIQDNERLAAGFAPNKLHYDNELAMCFGTGGVYATASDLANFGAGFFNGNDVILSENSKNEMSKRSSDDEYMDGSGLGWDYAGMEKYNKAGVQFLAKGGDVSLNHSFLCVAPEENISISVLTNGGSSSYNGSFAMALMDIILEDRGIKPGEEEAPAYEIVGVIPEEYLEYTGMYTSADSKNGAAVLCNVSFPDRKYMHVTSITPLTTEHKDYLLTKNGSFVELAYELENGNTAEARISSNPAELRFVKAANGKTYFTFEAEQVIPSIGKLERKMYAGERIEANPLSEEIRNSWKQVSGKEFKLCNDLYSSRWYDDPLAVVYTIDEFEGYAYMIVCGNARILKIVDETHAIAFQSTPSSASRDLVDVTLIKDEKGIRLALSTGIECISVDDIPVFDGSIKTVELKDDEAKWFRISDSMAGTDITADMQESSAIYIFNRFSEMVYNTHVVDVSPEIPLPKDGYILFLGKTGDSIEIK